MKVFIADDEAIIREGLKYIIDWEELGFEICGEASNGEDTLNNILKLKPDLVLLDIRMPKMQGTEIIQSARTNNFKGKFIILSGFTESKYTQAAMKYGVDFYLTKPIDEDELYHMVKAMKEVIQNENKNKSSLTSNDSNQNSMFLRDILLNTADYQNSPIINQNMTASVYQVVIYESYNRNVHNQLYNFADLLKITNQEEIFFDLAEINQKDVILLKGDYAIEQFNNCLSHYEHCTQKGSPLDSLFIAYGHPVKSLQDIHDSYEEALKIIERRFFCAQNQHTAGYNSLPRTEEYTYVINSGEIDSYCERFILSIHSFNRAKITDILNQLERNLYYTHSDSAEIKQFLTDIYLRIKQYISQFYSVKNVPFSANTSVVDLIENKSFLYEIITFFSEQFDMIMNAIGN
jgi:two-component system response regulator YesN